MVAADLTDIRAITAGQGPHTTIREKDLTPFNSEKMFNFLLVFRMALEKSIKYSLF